MVEGEGFEPSKAEPTDLQSVPFDRSGTPPNEPSIILSLRIHVKRKVNIFVAGHVIFGLGHNTAVEIANEALRP